MAQLPEVVSNNKRPVNGVDDLTEEYEQDEIRKNRRPQVKKEAGVFVFQAWCHLSRSDFNSVSLSEGGWENKGGD
jgi:hypothetical protein